MQYRKLGRTGLDVSVVGLGLEHLETSDRKTVSDILSNHCLPCPAGIDIAEVTRLLDRMGMRGSMFEPETLRASYSALTAHAGDCTSCASCEARCPFHVGVVANMQRAAAVFGC